MRFCRQKNFLISQLAVEPPLLNSTVEDAVLVPDDCHLVVYVISPCFFSATPHISLGTVMPFERDRKRAVACLESKYTVYYEYIRCMGERARCRERKREKVQDITTKKGAALLYLRERESTKLVMAAAC